MTRRFLLTALAVAAAGCARAHAPARDQDAALVSRFLGCYALDLGEVRSYKLRLTDTLVGQRWVAVNVETGNRPGNEWQWAPLDSTRFYLGWGGIDASIQLTVTHRVSHYTATGKGEWASGPKPDSAELHAKVRPIDCAEAK